MIIAPQISSVNFIWNGNIGIAEASLPSVEYVLGKRFYDDACDEGFIVVSNRTSKPMGFVFSHHDFDMHGDVAAMVYKSTGYGSDGKFEIHILND